MNFTWCAQGVVCCDWDTVCGKPADCSVRRIISRGVVPLPQALSVPALGRLKDRLHRPKYRCIRSVVKPLGFGVTTLGDPNMLSDTSSPESQNAVSAAEKEPTYRETKTIY